MLVLCGSIALLQILFLGAIGWMVSQTNAQLEKQRRVKVVVGILSRLSNTTQRHTLGVLEVVTSKTAAIEPGGFVKHYTKILKVDSIPRDLAQLKRELRNYPETQSDVKGLEESYRAGLDLIDKLKMNLKTDSRMHYFLLYKLQEASNTSTEQLEKLESKFRHLEEAASEELQSQTDLLYNLALIFGLITNTTVAFLLYRFFLKDVIGRLSVVADNTVKLALGKPLSNRLVGSDEIAQLDESIRNLGHTLDDYKSKERTILENAAEFICSINDKGVFVQVNQASSSLWGYTPDELIGRRMSSVILQEETADTLSAIEKLFHERVPVTFENTVRHKEGAHLELLWSAQPGDDTSSVVMIAHDITERNRVLRLIKESEEQFRTIIDNLPVAVLTLSNAFQIRSANPTTTRMFQYLTNELLGRDFGLLFAGVSVAATDEASIVNAARTQAIELQAWRKNKTPLAVALNVSRYLSHGKEVFLAVLQDITTRREIELVKRDFISMISHDLRSPLTSLHGTLGMMAAQLEDAPATTENAHEKQILFETENKVGKLVHLINDFLDLEKIESGSFSFETQEATLLKMISAASERLQETCPDMERTIVCQSKDSNVPIRVDFERMVLAIVSFASAVIRFSPQSKEVVVTSDRMPNRITIFISGEGCTIPEHTRETCLKRYAIVDLAQHDTWTVSGLSLALARATIEAHRGTLAIETKHGQDGFTLSLPL